MGVALTVTPGNTYDVTVGTGGGSIAWVSPEGTLKVGPRSAGAVPTAWLTPPAARAR